MIAAIAAGASVVAAYACQLDAPRAITLDGDRATASAIGLPPAALQFTLTIEYGNPMQTKVDWPGDPLTMAGKFPTIATAPGAYAFSAYSGGPCMFTEQACLSQFNVVEAAGGTARLIVQPVALTSDQKAGTRNPFAVVATGTCTRTDAKK